MILQNMKKVKVHVTDVIWEGEELAANYFVTLGVHSNVLPDGINEKVREYLNTRHEKSRVKSFKVESVQRL